MEEVDKFFIVVIMLTIGFMAGAGFKEWDLDHEPCAVCMSFKDTETCKILDWCTKEQIERVCERRE